MLYLSGLKLLYFILTFNVVTFLLFKQINKKKIFFVFFGSFFAVRRRFLRKAKYICKTSHPYVLSHMCYINLMIWKIIKTPTEASRLRKAAVLQPSVLKAGSSTRVFLRMSKNLLKNYFVKHLRKADSVAEWRKCLCFIFMYVLKFGFCRIDLVRTGWNFGLG